MTTIQKEDIKELHKQGSLRDIDYFLTETLEREYKESTPELLLAAALASHNMTETHVCIDIDKLAGKKWPEKDTEKVDTNEQDLYQVALPDEDTWKEKLETSTLCNNSKSPLVLDGNRLYLRRYFRYEQTVANKLLALASPDRNTTSNLSTNDRDKLLNILFDDKSTIQKEAAKLILSNQLLIISGGPGTGKTYMLSRLIAMLVAAAEVTNENIDIRMAAPTGKAAMRMQESIRNAKGDIKRTLKKIEQSDNVINILKDEIDNIPENACTIHRLLGTQIGSPYFKYNADNPLPTDILIIDEASMIDLPMMAKILNALQSDTKLILLGDMHQLSSVDPGYVLGDICKAAEENKDSNLGKSIVELIFSHRFDADSPIGQLSTALHHAGKEIDDLDGEQAWQKLKELDGQKTEGFKVNWHETPKNLRESNGSPNKDFRSEVLKNYKEFLNSTTPEEAFKALNKFRVFSPLRQGPHGLLTINKLIEDTLSLKNMRITNRDFKPLNTTGEFYDHRVIMVNTNNYGLQLFNGDMGIVLPEDTNGSQLDTDSYKSQNVIWFETTDEATGKKGFRSFPCNMIPPHETAFAMTIHKSQGSQYENIMIIMPERDNEKLFTKELLYTAITRAEKEVSLWCNKDIFKKTATRQTECTSGLKERLNKCVTK